MGRRTSTPHELSRFLADQVLTSNVGEKPVILEIAQGLTCDSGASSGRVSSYYDIYGAPLDGDHELGTRCREPRAPPPRDTPKCGKPGKKRRKSGGWRSTNSLTWDEVKLISKIVKRARDAGTPMNFFMTLRSPQGLTDVQCKRWISREIAHIDQALKRRGQKCVRLTVYEKRPGGRLHAHVLLYVEKANRDVLERHHDGIVIDVRRAREYHTAYITKQRRPNSPDFEKSLRLRRQKGAAIPGPRWSASQEALALVGLSRK